MICSTCLTCLTLLTFLPRSETALLRTALAVSALPPLWRLAVLHPWCRFTSRWRAVSAFRSAWLLTRPPGFPTPCSKSKDKRFQLSRTYRDVAKARRTAVRRQNTVSLPPWGLRGGSHEQEPPPCVWSAPFCLCDSQSLKSWGEVRVAAVLNTLRGYCPWIHWMNVCASGTMDVGGKSKKKEK